MMGKAESRRETGWRMELRETTPGVWAWQAVCPLILWPERREGRNLFSAIGLGAESWRFSLRPGQISRDDAILYDGCHHFLSSCQRSSPRMEVWETARVRPVQAIRTRYAAAPDARNIRRRELDPAATLRFPVILTEKYRRTEMEEHHAAETHLLVAVLPKRIECRLHDLLTLEERQYAVIAAHETDSWKNEYEIQYQGDV